MDRSKEILDQLEELIWHVDDTGHVDYLNERWYTHTGQSRTPGPMPSAMLEEWIHPDDLEATRLHWQQMQTDKRSVTFEIRLRNAQGSYRWFLCRSTPNFKAGQLVGWLAGCTDLEQQRDTEQRHRFLFDHSPYGVVYQNAQGAIVAANPAAQSILGLSLDQLQGRTSLDPRWQAVHPDGTPFPGEAHPAAVALRTGRPSHAIMGVFDPSREEQRWIKVTAMPQLTSNGRAYEVMAVFEDITEARQSAEALNRSEARSREILESITDAFFALDRGWNFTYVNHEAEHLLGRSAQSLLGQNVWVAYADAVGSSFYHQYHKAMAGQSVSFQEFYLPLNKWFEVWAYPAATGISVYFHDISARRATEEALRLSEERYRTLFDSVEQGVCIFEMIYDAWGKAIDYRFLEVNPTFEGHTGLINAAGKTAKELVPGLEDHWVETYAKVAESGQPFSFEEGSAVMGRWFEVNAVRVGGDKSRKVALLFSDVSERKRSEAALRESEAWLQLGTQVAGLALAEVDYQTDTIRLTPEACQIYGLPAGELVVPREQVHAMFHPEDRAELENRIAEVLDPAGENWFALDHRILLPSGEVRWLSLRKQVFFDHSNQPAKPVRATWAALDITQRKNSELALAQSEERYRLLSESQKRFVADASHELRAPLTSIQGNLELLQRFRDMAPADRNQAIDEAAREAARLGRLVSDLLSLARGDSGLQLNMTLVSLKEIVQEAFSEARHHGCNHRLEQGELSEVKVIGNRDRLKQLAVILLDNAIKYTPVGGQIRFELYSRDGYAMLRVSDTGQGIDAKDLPHIFERFYRTEKSRSQESGGSGLGLSIAQWIVHQHQGVIEVESTVGVGTVFTVHIPLQNRQT